MKLVIKNLNQRMSTISSTWLAKNTPIRRMTDCWNVWERNQASKIICFLRTGGAGEITLNKITKNASASSLWYQPRHSLAWRILRITTFCHEFLMKGVPCELLHLLIPPDTKSPEMYGNVWSELAFTIREEKCIEFLRGRTSRRSTKILDINPSIINLEVR